MDTSSDRVLRFHYYTHNKISSSLDGIRMDPEVLRKEYADVFVHKSTFDCIVKKKCVACLYKIFPSGNKRALADIVFPPNQRPEHCFHFKLEHIPKTHQWTGLYHISSKLLTVGDGDFSFSLSLTSIEHKSHHYLTATSHENRETLLSVYPHCNNILDTLTTSKGVCVHHGIDATVLSQQSEIILNSADLIIWNFPCVNAIPGADGQVSEIDTNREMLRKFFQNSVPCLREDGLREIHVTHKTIEPFSWWKIVELATEAGLTFLGSVCFDRCLYPGYINRKVLDKKSFPSNDAQTYIFRAASSAAAVPSTLERHPYLLSVASDHTWGALMEHLQRNYGHTVQPTPSITLPTTNSLPTNKSSKLLAIVSESTGDSMTDAQSSGVLAAGNSILATASARKREQLTELSQSSNKKKKKKLTP